MHNSMIGMFGYLLVMKCLKFMCFTKDIVCTSLVDHDPQGCCETCEAPACKECAGQVFRKKLEMPPAALTNDPRICYAPKELYEDDVTVMEMMCVSARVTSMNCFTLEKKYMGQPRFG